MALQAKITNVKRTYILVILDGWGIGKKDSSNPIYAVSPEIIKTIQNNYPCGALQASGIAVGLPWKEEGNSEVGHMIIGAGKTLYQYALKISTAIDDGSFFENQNLKNAFTHAKNNKSNLHLIGLLSEGNVHSSFKHLATLIKMAKKEKCEKVNLHIFTDGRDSRPQSAMNLIQKLNTEIQKNPGPEFKLATLSGRYFSMNRDNYWERTEKAYRILTETNSIPKPPEEIIKETYQKNLNDEYIEPTMIENGAIQDNDAIIFFNFREDRMQQITAPFLNPDFDKFPVKKFQNLYVVTMTKYQDKYPEIFAWSQEISENPLGKILSDHKKNQLRIAETEKYAHVTYFFNNLRKEPFTDEFRILIPSNKIAHHDEKPEMMAQAITDRALFAINGGGFDFILVNYANPDMIAHTGNYNATIKAIKFLDKQIERLYKNVLEHNHVLLITSDHGNAENLIDLNSGEPETKHNINPVPFYLIAKEFQGKNKSTTGSLPVIGLLSDVAPTILELMNIPKPKEMIGQSLLEQLL